MTPAGLDHSDLQVAEVIDDVFEEIGWRNEIRIEDCDQLSSRRFQAVLQRTGFESMPVRTMHMMNIETKLPMFGNTCRGNLNSAIGGVVEELNLEQLARITDVACRFHEPLDDIHLVVDRQLNRDARFVFQFPLGLGDLVLVFQIQINKVIAMDSINGEDAQYRQ